MKLVYLINSLYNSGGVERILSQKINYLSEKFKYEILIVTTDQKKKEPFFKLNKNIKIKDLDINYSEDKNKNFFIRIPIYVLKQIKHKIKLQEIIKEYKPDVIICTGSEDKFILPKLNSHIPIVKENHFNKDHMKNYSKSKKNILYKIIFFMISWKENKFPKLYNKVVVLTEEDKKKWNNEKIEVIPNFINYISEKVAECNNKKIISVGRLEYQKGYDILIEVWNMISKKYPDWILEIYGEGIERENLQNKIDELGLEKSFLLKGAVKNIQDKYLESSIYVMSSRYEGMPMVLLEAMAYGLPVISFDCPCGPKDTIKDNEDGFLVSFGNIALMAEKIEELIINEEKRKLFGINSRKNVQRFSKDKIMEQWNKLFIELMEK